MSGADGESSLEIERNFRRFSGLTNSLAPEWTKTFSAELKEAPAVAAESPSEVVVGTMILM